MSIQNCKAYRRVLVASDFSESSATAIRQAVWMARRCGLSVSFAHCLEHLRRAAHSLTFKAKIDLLSAEGDLFQREIRQESDRKLKQQIHDAGADDLPMSIETLLGEPVIELTHAVQQEGYDLVIVGSHGQSGWREFLVGSTARKLIRKCPADVWVVRQDAPVPPRVMLATTDFSDVSRKAVIRGIQVAERTGAVIHLLHVIDSGDIPDNLLERIPDGMSMRQAINEEASNRLQEFTATLPPAASRMHSHISYGVPWKEIMHFVQKHSIDLVCTGTVGRSGIKGLLLGNTAEKILEACHCSVLTTKPDDFVSPIDPATWPLHP
jgi:universal stress protein E